MTKQGKTKEEPAEAVRKEVVQAVITKRKHKQEHVKDKQHFRQLTVVVNDALKVSVVGAVYVLSMYGYEAIY